LRTEPSPGQTIALQRGRQKASFRVIWSKHLATNENQAGIEALNHEGNIWGVELPPSRYVPEAPASTWSAIYSRSISFSQALGLEFGLLCLGLALGLSYYHETFYEPGRIAMQAHLPSSLAPRISPTLRPAHIPCRFCSPELGPLPRRVWK